MVRKGVYPRSFLTASQAERGQAPFLTMSFFVLNYPRAKLELILIACVLATIAGPSQLSPELVESNSSTCALPANFIASRMRVRSPRLDR